MIGAELFMLLANIRLLWMNWNNFLGQQVDPEWTLKINKYVKCILHGRNERSIRIDFKKTNFITDRCHWIMNNAIREAFSNGCEC